MKLHSVTYNVRNDLRAELTLRCKKNGKYSLRAFAKALNMQPSILSKIIRGKTAVTEKMLTRICSALEISDLDKSRFQNNLKLEKLKFKGLKDLDGVDQTEINDIGADDFRIISDWQHLAILELLAVSGFKPSIATISRCLNLTLEESKQSVDRLVRVGMLEILPNGRWVDKSGSVSTTSNNFTNEALKKLQLQVLNQAISAIEKIDLEKRDQSTITFALDESLVPEIKSRLKIFRRSLAQYIQKKSTRNTHVYQMSFSLFPVSSSIK